jgi:hypothetical protein
MLGMRTDQAIIAIGGKATRIRGAGFNVRLSKSFIPVHGRPILHWNLLSLHTAGVRSVVLCADHSLQLQEAELIFDDLNPKFDDIRFFRDRGVGVHGLPYQVLSKEPKWLKDSFIFECGHSLMTPAHYRELVHAKAGASVVFSAFKPHPSNPRQPVLLSGPQVRLIDYDHPNARALAHPIVADRVYAAKLPALGFNIRSILSYYSAGSRLRYVPSRMPPEFDLLAEMHEAFQKYDELVAPELVSH